MLISDLRGLGPDDGSVRQAGEPTAYVIGQVLVLGIGALPQL
jgi:hypothetical protein